MTVSAALFSGQVTTFKWQVSVPSTVSKVAWKQVIFQITTLDVTLSDFRIYKGAIELSDMEALIVRGSDGASVVHDVAVTGDTAADYIIVRLMNEEVIAVGSSITYTLRAMASDVGSESAVGMSFVAKLWSCATGLLVEHQDEHFINALSVKTDGSWAAYGPMIWSDMSAVPHSAAMREPGYGSADWTNCIDVPSGMWIIVQ